MKRLQKMTIKILRQLVKLSATYAGDINYWNIAAWYEVDRFEASKDKAQPIQG